MKKLTHKKKKWLTIRAKNEEKRKKRIGQLRKPRKKHIPINSKIINITGDFDLKKENIGKTLLIIKELKKVKQSKNPIINQVLIDMQDVSSIKEGAISMLLSVIEELHHNGILIKGRKPRNLEANSVLERSGFFENMSTKINEHNITTKNSIISTIRGDESLGEKITKEIRKTVKTVWGYHGARHQELYDLLHEVIGNSRNHAFGEKEDIVVHMGVAHDEANNQVRFSLVDNGIGIIQSYKKKDNFIKRILSGYKSNPSKILHDAYNGNRNSTTGHKWRGKGLPSIYESFQAQAVTNLIVITNNAYIDFDSSVAMTLRVNFSGTYYFWKVTQDCSENSVLK